jgi:hypothetical protein
MLNRLDHFTKIKSVIGIEATFQAEDRIQFNCVQLSLKKNVLYVDKKLSDIESIASLVAGTDKNVPVCISLNGKGILHKKINSVATDPQKLLLGVLPNARIDDFYLQHYISDSGVFVSVIRRTVLHDLVSAFNAHQLNVISITLGPFILENLIPLISDLSPSFSIGNHNIVLREGKISDYQFSRQETTHHVVTIDSDSLEGNLIVAYATALQILADSGDIGMQIDEITAQRKEVADKKIFETAGWTALISALTILLLNFILFTYYTGKNNQLSGAQSKHLDYSAVLDSISKKVAERESFLLRAGWMRPSLISYYADQLGTTLPETITLNDLTINPLDDQSTRKEKKLVFISDKIHVSGVCNKPTDLNSWIQDIQVLDWVKAVEINNYTYDKKSGKGNFLINITIK